MRRLTRPPQPLPEAIAEGPWSIEATPHDNVGMTSRGSHIFAVPLTRSPLARAVRAHELSHLRWSPDVCDPAAHGVTMQSLQVAEDGRVNQLGAAANPEAFAGSTLKAEPTIPDPDKDFRGALLLSVARTGTPSGTSLRKRWRTRMNRSSGARAVSAALGRIGAIYRSGGDAPTFDETVAVARYLDVLLALDAAPADPGDGTETLEHQAQGNIFSDDAAWGPMSIDGPILSVPYRSATNAHRPRATAEGCIPRNLSRYATDGAIFAAKSRARSGTVLVDCSGSMRFTPQDLLRILAAAPAALVATYSGNRYTGTLRLIARSGHRVPDAQVGKSKGWNTIDGPALRWLAKQPGPRLWVSDGLVNGLSGCTSGALAAECAVTCRTHAIRRVDGVSDAARALTRKR